MSRRVRRRLNNPLDQWTPATVAAAQANRPRRFGPRGFRNVPGSIVVGEQSAELLGRVYRDHLRDSVNTVAPPGHPGHANIVNWVSDVIDRSHYADYSDHTGNQTRHDWLDYGPGGSQTRQDWTRAQHASNFGRVVQTFRQAVARIVRRAKWRRIIRALKLHARDGHGLLTRTVLYQGRPGPSMWPHVRDPQQASNQEVADYSARFGGFAVPLGGLRGTGTQGF